MTLFSCIKAYDIRGRLGIDLQVFLRLALSFLRSGRIASRLSGLRR